MEIGAEQILQLRAIAQEYDNFQCVECAQAIQDYLVAQGIRGKRIKLYTGLASKWDENIYDDIIEDVISVNGRHEGISIAIAEIETVYDNIHPNGIPRDEWIANLQFDSKVRLGNQFQVTENEF